jgi:hypothetical protein
MSKISEEGKKLDQALLAIYQDQNLTKKQTCEQASALIKEASEQVKKELKLKDLECDF